MAYINPAGVAGLDYFHYLIEDSCGKVATGLVTVLNVDASARIADGTYRLTPKHNTSLALGVSSTSNGTYPAVYTWRNITNNKWQIVHLERNLYRIQPLGDTGKSLDVSGGGGSGSDVLIWTTHSNENQKWFANDDDGDGWYELVSAHNSGIALDVSGNGGDGTEVNVWNKTNGDNQRWRFEEQ